MASQVMDEVFCDETFVRLASNAGIWGPLTFNLNEGQSSINTVYQKVRALMLAYQCNVKAFVLYIVISSLTSIIWVIALPLGKWRGPIRSKIFTTK